MGPGFTCFSSAGWSSIGEVSESVGLHITGTENTSIVNLCYCCFAVTKKNWVEQKSLWYLQICGTCWGNHTTCSFEYLVELNSCWACFFIIIILKKQYINRILLMGLFHFFQGSAHTRPALTPVEVLIAIHNIIPEKDGLPLKKVWLTSFWIICSLIMGFQTFYPSNFNQLLNIPSLIMFPSNCTELPSMACNFLLSPALYMALQGSISLEMSCSHS